MEAAPINDLPTAVRTARLELANAITELTKVLEMVAVSLMLIRAIVIIKACFSRSSDN